CCQFSEALACKLSSASFAKISKLTAFAMIFPSSRSLGFGPRGSRPTDAAIFGAATRQAFGEAFRQLRLPEGLHPTNSNHSTVAKGSSSKNRGTEQVPTRVPRVLLANS